MLSVRLKTPIARFLLLLYEHVFPSVTLVLNNIKTLRLLTNELQWKWRPLMNKAGAYLSIFTMAVSWEYFPRPLQEVLNIIIRSSLIFFFQLRLILHFLLFIFSPLHVYLLRLSNSPGNDFTFKEHFAVHLIFNIHFFFRPPFFFLSVLLTASRASNS